MSDKLTLSTLRHAIAGSAAALRARTRLQPAGGAGDKVFPPTFAGATYQLEYRRVPGREEAVPCVVLDTVQSQANRMEEALLQAVETGRLEIPIVATDFSGADLVEPIGRITTLEAPHRIADALLRYSQTKTGREFRASEEGRALDQASARNATPLFRLCPTALVFGLWDSTGPKGGLGVRFERAIVAETVGVNIAQGARSASRVDPVVKRTEGVTVYQKKGGGWTVDPASAESQSGRPATYGKKGKISELNLGNVTPSLIDNKTKEPLHGGVTFDYAEQTVTLSLIALRRLGFPVGEGRETKRDTAADEAARTVLAALGLCGATLAFQKGMDLRSRCTLWPEEPMTWELLDRPGKKPASFELDDETALALVGDAVAAAERAGLHWLTEPLVLTPSDELVKLVRKSQEAAVAEGVEE